MNLNNFFFGGRGTLLYESGEEPAKKVNVQAHKLYVCLNVQDHYLLQLFFFFCFSSKS